MPNLKLPIYAEGILYPPTAPANQPVATTIQQLQNSGFSTPTLGLFHIGRNYGISPPQHMGDLYFNDTLVISQGRYVGDAAWPALVNQLIGGSVTDVCASIGGGSPVMDFQTISRIYQENGNSFHGTNLMTTFETFRKTFPAISTIDMDCEETYDEASFVAFCRMLIDLGFSITFCPYTNQSFWTSCLAQLNQSNPGAVEWWNLQCYDGGAGNQPGQWAQAIAAAIPGFSTSRYIVPGDWTNDSAQQVAQLLAAFKDEPSVGGGFLWTLDQIIQQNPQDPSAALLAYANAIATGLGQAFAAPEGSRVVSGASR